MASNNEENQKNYDHWATFYDEYPNPTVAIDDLNFPEFYEPLKNMNVLEIGCGTGRHTRRLIAAGNHVTGIDISPGMLQKCREKIKDPKLTLIQGDFLKDPIPGGPFDGIVASLVMEHMPSLPQFFSKVDSLLKSGGSFYLSEIHPGRAHAGILAHFKDPSGKEVHLASTAHSEVQIAGAATDAGFRIHRVETVVGTFELTKIHERWARYEKLPMIQIWVMTVV